MAGTALPKKSSIRYEQSYLLFMNWCKENKIEEISEEVIMNYFTSKAPNRKPTSLWALYSMLRSTLACKQNLDISTYTDLLGYLRQQNVGYKSKKSKKFTQDEMNEFLRSAPDEVYLATKVCLMIGVTGYFGREEFRQMNIDDIDDKGNVMIFTVQDCRTGKRRHFTLTNEDYEGINVLELVRKYRALRPPNCEHKKFFINYRVGKCYSQVIGINAYTKMPSQIAKYLNLPDVTAYTAHSFRQTSLSLLKTKFFFKGFKF